MLFRSVTSWMLCWCVVAATTAGVGRCLADINVNVTATQNNVIEVVPKTGGRGKIDWTQGVLIVTAKGVAKTGTTGGKAELTAREAALATGYRDLVAAVKGVQVTARIKVKDCELENSEIEVKIDGIIKGATPITDQEKWDEGKGIYTVMMALPLFGENSVASIVMPTVQKTEEALEKQKPEKPVVKIPPTPPPTPQPLPKPADQTGPFSSLIVDCRGLGVERAMSPKVVDADQKVIYGVLGVLDMDLVENRGMVSYLLKIDDAKKNERAGDNPLIIRAVGSGGFSQFRPNAVVSAADGALILSENEKSKFLEKLNVIFVVDQKK